MREQKEVREVILDTETTGLDPKQGHRITEIGCIELINKRKTDRIFHTYINPERDVPKEAERITGLTYDFLKKYPVFKNIAQDFLAFVKDATLVIHNASFDICFLNSELERLDLVGFNVDHTIDTLKIAKSKFPGSPGSLDALCKRYNIDQTHRSKHGALLDAQLLYEVYLELCGGRQQRFFKEPAPRVASNTLGINNSKKINRLARSFSLSDKENQQHIDFIQQIKDSLWPLQK